jgi:MYXO-CTERM domain-containing protein
MTFSEANAFVSRVALLFATTLSLAAMPERASACLPAPSCGNVAFTVPPNGAVGVPLNVELEAMPFNVTAYTPPTAVALVLRVADTGEDVVLGPARTLGRARPESPLLPETRYELYAPPALRRSVFGTECGTEPTALVATFTTGTTSDVVAPAAVTAAGTGCGGASCDNGACCGPYVAVLHYAAWSATDDGALPVAYAFGSPDGPRTLATMGTSVGYESGYGRSPFWIDIPGASPVHAIDAAGNVSLESAEFTLGCAPVPPAPPAPVEPPAEPPADGSCDGGACAPPTDADGGCSVTTAPHTRNGSFAILLLVAALFAARRRSTRRWPSAQARANGLRRGSTSSLPAQ